mmetsp:Transcript_20677/g.41005  ORF Transcript_20677/g.41005 Transcript_20677/m.41005 type:complete len:85 (-) Transcript_20677:300-554(-)
MLSIEEWNKGADLSKATGACEEMFELAALSAVSNIASKSCCLWAGCIVVPEKARISCPRCLTATAQSRSHAICLRRASDIATTC